jgi:hypothetical protein
MAIKDDSFPDFIQREAQKVEQEPEKFFTLWYVKQKYGDGGHYTDGKDGGIDYIVEKNGQLIIIQTKLGNISADEFDRFLKAVEHFETKDEKAFKSWIEHDVKSKSDKDIFQSLYNKYKSKDKSYEVVVFKSKSEAFEKKIKASRHKGNITLVGCDDLIYLYNLYLIGVREAPELVLKTDRTSLDFNDTSVPYTTRAFIVKLKPLLEFLNTNPDSELVFGRNVRVYHGSTEVNEEMAKTWQTKPDLFFYGNNGIHIICNQCRGGAGEQTLINPQIINGSQTLHTLKLSGGSNDGWILARITVIPKGDQLKPEIQDMIDKMILYSNRNNVMDPMDLRSNDEIQVRLARELFARKIFYERKTKEWERVKTHHSEVIHTIDARDLGILTMVCDGRYGPVYYKDKGHVVIFRSVDKENPDWGFYPDIFKEAYEAINQTETKIRLYSFLKRALKSVKPQSKEAKRVPSSSLNYITSIFWDAIDGYSFRYPIKIPFDGKADKLKSATIDFGKEIVSDFEKRNKEGIITVLDYFRTKDTFDYCRQKFREDKYSERLKEAIEEIIEPQN